MEYKTILVTGGTGYIGSWTVKYLLEKGYTVKLGMRNPEKKDNYSLLSELAEKSNGSLEVFKADLMEKGSYDEAAQTADAIFHIASPFTLKFKDPVKELIQPAVEGTKNVLNAAMQSERVKKVILTSSVAAVHGDNIDMYEQNLKEFDESHFNTTSSEKHQPYSYSKVAAEKAAWEIAKSQKKWEMVVINPSFVMGPPLIPGSKSESLTFMRDLLKGKMFFGAPDLHFGFVDVRDVARAHVLALESSSAEGRHILAERTMSIVGLSQIIRNIYGKKYKVPKSKSPKFILYLFGGLFGVTPKFIKRNVGYPIKLNNSKSIEKLKLTYTPMEKSIQDMVEGLKA